MAWITRSRREAAWYEGTADAVQQNFSFVKQSSPDHVLILSGDHVYTMDYNEMIAFHQENQADLTLATVCVPCHGSMTGKEQEFVEWREL